MSIVVVRVVRGDEGIERNVASGGAEVIERKVRALVVLDCVHWGRLVDIVNGLKKELGVTTLTTVENTIYKLTRSKGL